MVCGVDKTLLKNKSSPTNISGFPVAVITRATLRPSRLFEFWKSVPHASSAIENAAGVKVL